jgi:hypothetical protein
MQEEMGDKYKQQKKEREGTDAYTGSYPRTV